MPKDAHCSKGGMQQLRGQNFAIFYPLPPLRGQFLYSERGQIQAFFEPRSSSCPRSYGMTPNVVMI